MAQDILIKRSSIVYASESEAWAALDKATFRKGMPLIACYTKTGTTHGDTTVGAIYAVGTADGVGKYQAFASYEDFYAVYTDLGVVSDTLSTFIEKFNSMFTIDGEYIKANKNFYSVGEIAAGGKPDGGGSTIEGSIVTYEDNPNVSGGLVLGTIVVDGIGYPVVMPSVAQLASEGLATKDYVDNAVQDAKDTRVDTLVNTTIPAIDNRVTTAQNTANDAQSKANTLIGSDSGKSVRDISKLAVAELLEGADADFDTLIEIAKYLESHETDAVAMNNAIEALKKITKHFYNNGTVTEDSVKTYIDNAKQAALDATKALEDGDVATAISSINTLKGITITAGNGLTGGGNLSANRTITLGTPSTITDSSSNSVTAESHTHAIDKASTSQRGIVQLNNTISSTSTEQAATANAVKTAYDKANSAQTDLDTLEAKTITAGDAITTSGTLLSGAKVDVNVDGTSIVVSGNKLAVSVIDGGTF